MVNDKRVLWGGVYSVVCLGWRGPSSRATNTRLLEGRISFFQSVCVLGYCVFPLCISALLRRLCQLVLAGDVL